MSNESLYRVQGVKITGRKFILGMLLAPIVLGLAWCRPVEVGDFADSKYLLLLVLNTLTAYPDFAFHFFITHLIVTKAKLASWAYFVIILALSILIFIGLQIYYLHGINGLGYNEVVVLQNGRITISGLVYLLKEGVLNAVAHVGAMIILWYVAFRQRISRDIST